MHVLHRLERRVVFLVAVPVGLFLLIASMPGVVSQFSAFEDGQSLTTLRLVQHGAFPWRDWATTHGVLEDALQTLLSSSLIQDSTWGITAGYTLLVVPALLLSVYYLAYRVLGHTWPFLVALGLTFLDPGYASALAFLRFAFWPLLLILLGVVIDRRRPWLAVVLGAALVVQAVVSQETAYCIPAVGIAILGSDVQRVDWRRRGSRLRGFAMTAWTAAGGAIVAVVLMVILVSQHALGDFIRFYTAFLPDHALTGGIPHLPFTGRYRIEAVLPIAGMLAAVALLVSKLWLRRVITTLDWMLAAATILAFLYYPKFLDRADGHVERALATSLPMLLILAAAALKAAEPAAARVLRAARGPAVLRYSVAAVFMAIVLLVVPIRLGAAVSAAPSNFRMVAASEPSIPALGYHAPTAIDPTLVSDLGTFLHAYLKPGDHVFDFSNEPGLLYYLLDFRPSTPYYTVSVAMRHVVQQDLVDRLRVDRPLFVVYTQGEIGLPAWDDVPNMVRHYDVSQYLLANYRPFAQVHGQVIYVDRRANVADPATLRLSLSTPLVTADLPFRGSRCDWGYSPNFLSVAPADPRSGHESLTVTLTRDGPLSYTLTLPPGRRWDEFHWFEIHPSAAFSSSVTSYQLEDQPPPAGEQRAVTFVTDASSPASYRFPIGACSQWPAYESAPLHLTMSAPQEIASVRLAP
jgi:hypothetical protein